MAACLRALKERHGVALQVVRWPPSGEAPFEDQLFAWIDELHNRAELTASDIYHLTQAFNPQAILMAGWIDGAYLEVARKLRRQGIVVVAGSDTQWIGSVRQQLGRLIAPWYLRSAIDVLWVAGERQRQLAVKLGFTGQRCINGGYYTCDWPQFSGPFEERQGAGRSRSFLYVGRYVAQKGIDVLVEGYRLYREQIIDPWPLVCVGSGDAVGLLAGRPGIEDRGFIRPAALPCLFADAGVFVLPSREEPWGVVLHEAAAAGLPLVSSDASGAAVHLLVDGYNGFSFESGNARHLAHAMVNISQASDAELEAMGQSSHQLSLNYTPHRWADTFMRAVGFFRTG